MAQTPAQRRAAQRRLAKELKERKHNILTPAQKGRTKAAHALKYTPTQWRALPAEERKRLRQYVDNAESRIKRYAQHRKAGDADIYYPDDYRDDWETWEWNMYREAA